MSPRVNLYKVADFVPPFCFSRRALRAAVEKCLEPLSLGARQKRVLIKPNMVGFNPAVRGITTQVEVALALIDLLKEAGVGQIVVGDGSFVGGPKTLDSFHKNGYEAVIREGASLLDFNEPRLQRFSLGNNSGLSPIREFPLPALLQDIDLYFNVPVIKTHFSTVATLSLKNNKGLMAPGTKKASHYHGVAQAVADLNLTLRDFFARQGINQAVLVDGLVGMEGNGPGAGVDRPLGIILSGTDSVGVDTYILRHVMGINPDLVEHLKLATIKQYGSWPLAEVQGYGDVEVKFSPFALPDGVFLGLQPGENLRVFVDKACCGCLGTVARLESAVTALALPAGPIDLYAGKVETKPADSKTAIAFGNCAVSSLSGYRGQLAGVKTEEVRGCPPIMEESVASLTLLRIEREAQGLHSQVKQIARELAELYRYRKEPRDQVKLVGERRQRADKAWAIVGQCSGLMKALEALPASGRKAKLIASLRDSKRCATRYNRESPVFLMTEPVSIFPATWCRNFLRDGIEQMYFLALHGLPSAYDLFSGTYTETPLGYKQVLHLHRYSEEVSLVLDGQSDCVWYTTGPDHQEAGRVTAGPFQAFRIPPRVVHTIHNPDTANDNITIKLTMFIDDRFDAYDHEFARLPKEVQPVVVDSGERIDNDWGQSLLYRHGFRGIKYAYKVDRILSGAEFPVSGEKESIYYVHRGEVIIPGEKDVRAEQGSILRLAQGLETRLLNFEDREAVLFSVEGLDYRHFLEHPEMYPDYPAWFKRDLARTTR